MFYCYCGIWIWQKQDGGLSSFSEKNNEFIRVLHKDHWANVNQFLPMWTNFDWCGPIWTNGDADHLQLAKITTKWLQSGKSADSQLQICNSAPRTAANVPITCWQASSSARDSTDNRGQGARPGLTPTSFHASASYCLLLPLLPPSLLGKLLVLHLTTSACKR